MAMMPTPSKSTLLTCTLATLLAGKLISWYRKTKKLPPGPPKLPIIDNLHNMPPGMDWLKYAEFAEQYGSDIIHMSALGNSLIVLHTFEAAQELLEQKSAIYSSRPYSVMINELCGFGDLFVFMGYTNHWKASRRLFNKHFGGANDLHRPREIFYIRRLLSQLLETPEEFRQRIRHCIGTISISMTYGLNAKPLHDPYIDMAEGINTEGVVIFMDNYLVDVFPSLKHLPPWIPGASFKRVASKMFDLVTRTQDTLFDDSRQKMQEGFFRTPSFISNGLQDLEESKNPEQDLRLLKDVASQVYLAAADTTTAAVSTFFLAMVCYPEVQKKLQHELDAALQGRLPLHEDVSSLPYLTAVIMETLRWKPTAPIGNPHCTTEDDVYNGYFIPKGSIVLPNQWAMSYDPRVYPDPEEFKPERFLKNGKIDESVRNPIDIAFGFGRRKCPGRHLAQSTLVLLAASVLTIFNLEKKLDENGNVVEPTREYTMTAIDHPKEFPCEIKPRSVQAKEVVTAWVATEGDNPP